MSPSSTSNSKDGDAGLFPVTARPASPGRRGVARWVVAFFLVVLTVTGLVDTLLPVPAPRLLGAERQEEERLRRSARFGDGTLARLVERDLRLRSRVRRTLGSYYALALFYFLDEAQGHVVVGHDGWLFLPGRTLLPRRDDRAVAATSAALLAAVERRLAAFGVRLIVVPVPRKSVLYADFLPRGIDPRADLDEELVRALERRGVTTVDLLGLFRRHRERHPEELLYFQSDSHWTDAAQVLAAEEICRTAGILVPERERLGRLVSLGPAPQERDHLEYIGLFLPERALDVLGLPRVERFGVERDGKILTDHENPPTMPAVAITGTSFTARRELPLLLEHFAAQPVWNAADVAAWPLATVARLLGEHPASLPEILVLELPGHHAIGLQPLQEVEPLLAGHPPPADVPRLVLRRMNTRAQPGRKEGFENARELARLPAGRLVHSADGIAALRLRGRVQGSRAWLTIVSGDNALRIPWPKDLRELVVPLTAAAPSGEAVSVFLLGHGALTLESADAVADFDETRAVAGRHARVAGDGGGWRQRLVFPDRPLIVHHAGLLLRLDVKGAAAGGRMRLSVAAPGGEPLGLDLAPVDARGVVLISLSPLQGRRLARVEIGGDGAPPRQVVKTVLFLPPAF